MNSQDKDKVLEQAAKYVIDILAGIMVLVLLYLVFSIAEKSISLKEWSKEALDLFKILGSVIIVTIVTNMKRVKHL